MKSVAMAEIVKLVHIFLILYVLFGWLINNEIIWYSIIILVPSLEIHWKTNNNQCFLTTLEKKLRKTNDNNSTFVGTLSIKYFNKELSDSMISFIIHFGMYSSALICLTRIIISN